MKSIHWFILIVLSWVSLIWWTYALSEMEIISIELPVMFIPFGGIGMILIMVLFEKVVLGEKSIITVFRRSIKAKYPVKQYVISAIPAFILLIVMTAYYLFSSTREISFAIPFSSSLIFILM